MHHPEKTAISRKEPSAPLIDLLQTDLIHGDVLDYGGGKGMDFLFLKFMKKKTFYWDPNFMRTKVGKDSLFVPFDCNYYDFYKDKKFDTVLVTYVLNVLPPVERKQVIDHVLSILKPKGVAIFTVRGLKDKISGTPYKDGVLTKKGTFQRLFNAEQLKEQIPNSESVLDTGRYVTVKVQSR
jgi:SAM-dependent methyltransferase